MDFSLIVAVAEESTAKKTSLVYQLSKSLNEFFQGKDYGSDVLSVTIGFIMVKTKPGYENWYQEKKPKYLNFKKYKSKLNGDEVELNKAFQYEIKLDDETLNLLLTSSDDIGKRIIACSILASLDKFETLLTKKRSFNPILFESDLQRFFENQGLL